MPKIIKEIHVLVGLPGSGKTTFAKQYDPAYLDQCDRMCMYNTKNKKPAHIVDYDEIYRKVGLDESKILEMPIPNIRYDYLILDGLFVTQADVEWVIGVYLNNPEFREKYTVEKIIIDVWITDKESCLWNDRARRNVRKTSSAFSIRIMEPERINVKSIEEKFGVKTKLELHSVVRAPAYQVMAAENNIANGGKYLESQSWCLGGKSYSWRGNEGFISPEDPLNFDEFDELLEKICPQITYLQYKKIYAKCVTREDRSSSDYYTDAREGYWQCDLEKLYEMLDEMGLYHLDDEDLTDY